MFLKMYKREASLFFFELLFLFFLPISISLGQITYYVASNGNDSNNGRSSTFPFQTLSKINGLSLQPGDKVLFRRGDTFRGTLTIRRSGSASAPIIFDAYDSGPKPVLAGSVPVINWTNAGNNIWQASCPTCGTAVTGLYRNGVPLSLGRYPNPDEPNKGNLTIRAHTQKYQIFSQEHLPTTIDWQGAEVVMRPTPWIIDRAVVDHQYGDALNLFNYSNYTPRDNSEYFFQNHPATLDRDDEWCYDATNKKLLLYNTQNVLPSQLLTTTVNSRGIDLANVSFIELRNLRCTETLNTNIIAQNVSNLSLINLDITNAGEDGVIISGSGKNIIMENNTVTSINNNGLVIDAYQTVTLRGNLFRSIGIVPGRGKSGDGQYNGIASKANLAVLIEKNTIDSVGYNGITFWNNTTIQQNVISNYCYSKIDGGGIYCWNGNKAAMTNIHILSNILYNNPAGGAPWLDYTIGIFLDDCTENVDVRNNTVFGNTRGVFLHAANKITFTDNTLFNNSGTQLIVYHNGGVCPIRNDVIKRNICVSKESSQFTADYESNTNDLLLYGQIDSNYYARPFKEYGSVLGVINSTFGRGWSLDEWKSFSGGLDLHSTGSPITYKQYKNDGAGGTNKFNSTFDTSNDDWFLVYSRYNNGEVTQDNTNKLDNGSLRVGFTSSSGQSNSYAQAAKFVSLTKGKTYVLRFDAIATTKDTILVYLRQYGSPYKEYDERYSIPISTTRTSFELPFTPTDSDSNAVVMMQIDGEGPTFWLDNVRLQEDAPIRNNPDDFIKLFYNPTLRDSVITLEGVYRNVKNQIYTGSFTLSPFSSTILLKDTIPLLTTDLSLFLENEKRFLQVNEPVNFRLRVSNQSNVQAGLARWTCRLPAYLDFVDSSGQAYSDNVLTGELPQLAPQSDTVFTFLVRPTTAGLFHISAQITTANSPDSDSTPNSGTADGEDDAATAELRVGNTASAIVESPNPNQRLLPTVVSNQPTPSPDQADLNLQLVAGSRTLQIGNLLTFTLSVTNGGGLAADSVQLENQLPDGFELVDSTNWIVDGKYLRASLPPIAAGSTQTISFQVRATMPGNWINRAQIKASNVGDPDSIPGNGFLNGEDDQAQVDGRTQ
ncbi:right-handed parallel beta-helix repeat-containing protein [Spirosoma foliorum]|uniref:Right-handed parallel beta-helix repeat-containing protein n=1 Tax=Spirosoma foliorum TaxID=2710596 RepID=A0A7G5GYQ9_9BACT|nr:right-handed parallel beta-helix repeat-containing protein [Spirosoma foliorum]QMW04001.1 right-handed parallel beta-helix repeat-containing protein [Spirosoma foliorum]